MLQLCRCLHSAAQASQSATRALRLRRGALRPSKTPSHPVPVTHARTESTPWQPGAAAATAAILVASNPASCSVLADPGAVLALLVPPLNLSFGERARNRRQNGTPRQCQGHPGALNMPHEGPHPSSRAGLRDSCDRPRARCTTWRGLTTTCRRGIECPHACPLAGPLGRAATPRTGLGKEILLVEPTQRRPLPFAPS